MTTAALDTSDSPAIDVTTPLVAAESARGVQTASVRVDTERATPERVAIERTAGKRAPRQSYAISRCSDATGVPTGFLELPSRVYSADVNYVQEEPLSVLTALGRSNPYFAEGGHALTLCIADKVRLAVFAGPMVQVRGEPVAFFGYWESVGDLVADRAVFFEAMQWARDHGARALYGPVHFSTWGRWRLRLAGSGRSLPIFEEPYNPPNFPGMLDRLGFELHQSYLAQTLSREGAEALCTDYADRLTLWLSRGYQFESLTPSYWSANKEPCRRLVNAILEDNFAYTPLSPDAFDHVLGDSLIRRLCSESSVVVVSPEGEPVSLALVSPNWAPLCAHGAGAQRIAPSSIDYSFHIDALNQHCESRGLTKAAVVKLIGVTPELRRQGLMAATATAALARGADLFEVWIPPIIRRDNPSRRFCDRYGEGSARWYGLYRRDVESDVDVSD